MSRPLRIEYPGAWYHVMNRGRRAEEIFQGKDDYQCFLDILKESVEMWNLRISAYCLMPNHYHLLIQTPEGNLSRCMRHINGVYTQRYNRVHCYDGHLFRGRYKSVLVDESNYLLQLVRYIHRNPMRAYIVKEPVEYQWSSHKGYLSKSVKWAWLHKDFILSMLTKDPKRYNAAYKRFMHEKKDDEISDIFNKKKLPVFVGSQNFTDWVKETFYSEKQNNQIPDSSMLAPDISQIKLIISTYYKIDLTEFLKTRRGVSNEPRDVAIFLTRKIKRDTLLTIGNAFGMSGYSSVSSAIERVRKRTSDDKKFRNRVDKIYKLVIKGQTET